MTKAKIVEVLAWACEHLPEHPPRPAASGWCPKDLNEYRAKLKAARAVVNDYHAAKSH